MATGSRWTTATTVSWATSVLPAIPVTPTRRRAVPSGMPRWTTRLSESSGIDAPTHVRPGADPMLALRGSVEDDSCLRG